jgi:hypothetical protein
VLLLCGFPNEKKVRYDPDYYEIGLDIPLSVLWGNIQDPERLPPPPQSLLLSQWSPKPSRSRVSSQLPSNVSRQSTPFSVMAFSEFSPTSADLAICGK